jgi:hypothetical protein
VSRWLHVWGWAEEEARRADEERTARLREATAYFGLDPAEVLGHADREEALLARYARETSGA